MSMPDRWIDVHSGGATFWVWISELDDLKASLARGDDWIVLQCIDGDELNIRPCCIDGWAISTRESRRRGQELHDEIYHTKDKEDWEDD